jgi:hypothetical protein
VNNGDTGQNWSAILPGTVVDRNATMASGRNNGHFGNNVGRRLLAIWSDLKRSNLAALQDFPVVAGVGCRRSVVFSLCVRIDVQMALLILLAAATPTRRIAAWWFSCHGCSQTSVYRFLLSP